MKRGISLVEVLITMTIVGIIFSLTIPTLSKKNYSDEALKGFDIFNKSLQGAIDQWKVEIGCPLKAGECIRLQKEINLVQPDFNQIMQHLKVTDKIDKNSSSISYIPAETLNYYGNAKSIYDFKTNNKRDVYMLVNGMVFSVLPDDEGYWIIADVNGKRPPNRIGKDTFHFTIGYDTDSDINYYPKNKTEDGLCGHLNGTHHIKCNPENTNPLKDGGASPSMYVLLNKKLPNFEQLSKTVSGFQK